MKLAKILLALLLAVCAILTLPLSARAEETTPPTVDTSVPTEENSGEDSAETYDYYGSWYSINWSVSGNTLTISGSGDMVGLNFYYNYPWYDYSAGVTKLVIGDGVNSVSHDAFAYMTNLTSINFGKGLTSIGTGAFSYCTSLKSVKIPSNVVYLGGTAFANCTSLTSFELHPGITTLEFGTFMNCTGLKDVTLNTYCVSSNMFQGCTNLTTVTLGKNVKKIEYGAFEDCTALSKVNLTAVETIGSYAFNKCTGLKSFVFPATLTTIEGGAFNFTGLTAISIPNTVTTLGDYAFANCQSLTSVTLGSGISVIPDGCFNTDQNLISVNMGAATLIKDGSFAFCTSLNKITWPTKPFSIEYEAFEYCKGLTELNFPGTLRTIEGWAFSKCSALQSITFQQGVELVESYAFSDCENVTTFVCFDDDVTLESDVLDSYAEATLYGWPGSTTESHAASERLTFVPITMTAPTPKKIANTVSGIHVYWNPAEFAATYSLYRSTSANGTYTLVKSGIKSSHYTDTTVSSGKTYYYKVVSCNGPYGSGKSAAQIITYVGTPDITSRINNASGIKLGWNKISGATGYAIYRKSYSGSDAWVRIATISGNSTFTWTDTSVKNNNGTIYKYTIRALAGSNMKTLSGCRNTGRTMVRLSSQVLTSAAKADATSIKCQWTTSKAVTGYEVRFLVNGEVYKTYTIGNYKTGVKTFTGLKAGQTYTIQVRTYKKVDGVGSFYSDWSTAKTVKL